MIDRHVDAAWQSRDRTLWAEQPGGLVLIANFQVGHILSHDTQTANAARARLCVNYCRGVPTDVIVQAIKNGHTLADEYAVANALVTMRATGVMP